MDQLYSTQSDIIDHISNYINDHNIDRGVIAVAVSGGADSMALAHAIGQCSIQNDCNIELHILSVDHDLREGSNADSLFVQQYFQAKPYISSILKMNWNGKKPDVGIMKAARDARYDLMVQYCTAHGIKHLFLGHHEDDQMETFLMRLTKGSGLDGLTAMQERQSFIGHEPSQTAGLFLERPLLGYSHQDLILYCEAQNVPWLEDPTNQNVKYARNRMRASMGILKEEGLSAKRISVTAMRLSRAREALDYVVKDLKEKALISIDKDEIQYDWLMVRNYPEEIIIRLLLDVYGILCADKYYAPRLEKLEALADHLMRDPNYKSRTLGGLEIKLKHQALIVKKE